MSTEATIPAVTDVYWHPGARLMTAKLVYPIKQLTYARVGLHSGDIFVSPRDPDGTETIPNLTVKLGFFSPTFKRADTLLVEQVDGLNIGHHEGIMTLFDNRDDTRRLRLNNVTAPSLALVHYMRYGLWDNNSIGLTQPRCDVYIAPPPDAHVHYDLRAEYGNVRVSDVTGEQSSFEARVGDVSVTDFTGDANIMVKYGSVYADVQNGSVNVTKSKFVRRSTLIANEGRVDVEVGNKDLEVRATAGVGQLEYSDDFTVAKWHDGDDAKDATLQLGTARRRPFVTIFGRDGVKLSRTPESVS